MTPDAPPIAAVSRDTSPIRSTGTPMLFAYVGGPLSIPNGKCDGSRIDSYDILRETHTFVLSGYTAYGGEGESCGGPVERETVMLNILYREWRHPTLKHDQLVVLQWQFLS